MANLLKIDEDLEREECTSLTYCRENFLAKGGTILSADEGKIVIRPQDAIYPICSGGVCRSQTLWAILRPYSENIVLFPPHAARHGWDPYNSQINRFRCLAKETAPDEFAFFFGFEKEMRFGFEHVPDWESYAYEPTEVHLQKIRTYYTDHFFGPDSSWKGKKGVRRLYVAFAQNAHVALYRLCESNKNLEQTMLVYIDYDDLISHPPPEWQIVSRSVASYAKFSALLKKMFNFDRIHSSTMESSVSKR